MAIRSKFCFVISPIGAEGSEVRKHADTVFDCIIKPACESAGQDRTGTYYVERGDHKAAPGKITDQIYEDIMRADLIIAVLTGANPNVYYELAIAQSAAKPVILLMEKGFDAPFDIKDQRIIYYDFDPQLIFHQTYVKQLRAAIDALETQRRRPVVPFAPDLAPLGDPMQAVYQRASEAEEDTIRLVPTANRFVWMAGYSLKGWTMNQDFVNALKIRTPSLEFEFRTLLMSPDNPSMKASMKSDDIYESAAQSTMVAQKSWKRVHDQLGGAKTELRVSKSKSINYQMVLTDKEALVIPYLTSRDTLRSPYIYARKESFYYEALVEEYEFLWSHSEPVAQNSTSPSKKSKKSGK